MSKQIKNKKYDKLDRYQYQPWHIKLWRRRYYIPVPYYACKSYIKELFRTLTPEEIKLGLDKLSFKNCYSIHLGLASAKMNWLYDWKEVFTRIKKKYKFPKIKRFK